MAGKKFPFLSVDVKLTERERYQANLDDELDIDPDDILNEMRHHSQKFAWWAGLHIAACGLRDDFERDLKLLEAKLAGEIRDPDKKATEKSIKQEVIQDSSYQALQRRFLEAKRQVDVLYVGREAMTQRKDMLVSMATTLRRERDGDPGKHADAIAALEAREEDQRRQRRGRR